MGRPINKRILGLLATAGQQLQCTAWVAGDSQARTGSVIAQKGVNKYNVTTSGGTSKCALVNTTAAAAGQMTVKVLPYGISQGAGATATASLRVATIAVNAGGTGYSVNDVITVTGGTGTSATATVATVSGGVITGLTLTSAGNYTALPSATGAATTVAPSGGTGATVNLTFQLGNITVTAGGADYVVAPVVSFSAGIGTATATIVNGVVTAVAVGTRGTYAAIPTVTLTATSSGSGATATVSLRAKTIAVNAGGTGYSVGNVITVTGGTGTSITATVATVSSGVVTGLTLVNLGNYTALPSATGAATTVAPSGGTGLTVNLTFEVGVITVTGAGTGYLVAPTLTFSAGTATATATLVNGTITAITPVVRGTYATIPTLAITPGLGIVEYAKKITSNVVVTFAGNRYTWKPQGTALVAGEASLETA